MPTYCFHHVTEIVAERDTGLDRDWLDLTIVEERWDVQVKTRMTLYVDDPDLADRLTAAINGAQVKSEEAA